MWGGLWVQCPLCGLIVSSERLLDTHLDEVHDDCAVDTPSPLSSPSLERGLPIASKAKPSLPSKAPELQYASPQRTPPPAPEPLGLRCPLCDDDWICDTRERLGAHLYRVHSPPSVDQVVLEAEARLAQELEYVERAPRRSVSRGEISRRAAGS